MSLTAEERALLAADRPVARGRRPAAAPSRPAVPPTPAPIPEATVAAVRGPITPAQHVDDDGWGGLPVQMRG